MGALAAAVSEAARPEFGYRLTNASASSAASSVIRKGRPAGSLLLTLPPLASSATEVGETTPTGPGSKRGGSGVSQRTVSTPIPDEETLLPFPSSDRDVDLLVGVGHRPTQVATVGVKDAAGIVDVDLAEALVVSSLALIHRGRLSYADRSHN
jgi:hypothetical protein